jgi:hypothetical protein
MRIQERRDSIPAQLRLVTGALAALLVVATLANELFFDNPTFGRTIWIGGGAIIGLLGGMIYKSKRSSADVQ